MFVYVGTYTQGSSEGIYVYQLDQASGALTSAAGPAPTENPSFVALHPHQPFLYAVNELDEFQGRPGGGVSAYAIEEPSGALRLLNQQGSRGTAPCYVSIDATGRC